MMGHRTQKIIEHQSLGQPFVHTLTLTLVQSKAKQSKGSSFLLPDWSAEYRRGRGRIGTIYNTVVSCINPPRYTSPTLRHLILVTTTDVFFRWRTVLFSRYCTNEASRPFGAICGCAVYCIFFGFERARVVVFFGLVRRPPPLPNFEKENKRTSAGPAARRLKSLILNGLSSLQEKTKKNNV